MVWLFSRITSIVLSFLLSLFSIGPIFAVDTDQNYLVTITPSHWDNCTINIECREIDDAHIVCRSFGEILVPTGCTVQSIPSIQNPIVDIRTGVFGYRDNTYIQGHELSLLYEDPDTFIYPFVRITKIQV